MQSEIISSRYYKSIVASASTVGSRGQHGAIPYILTMKAINPRTNKPEDYTELISDDKSFIRFSDGSMIPKKEIQFEDTFEGFVDTINDEDLPEDTLESIVFRMFITVVSSIFTIAVLYYTVQGIIWSVQKLYSIFMI